MDLHTMFGALYTPRSDSKIRTVQCHLCKYTKTCRYVYVSESMNQSQVTFTQLVAETDVTHGPKYVC